jgi:queuine/archaeosine tRNA-ribosyltransferase
MAETAAQIAQHYTAMGHSVDLINAVIAGTQMADESADEKNACVDRNVEHLELMKTRDYWTSEDMTAVDAAIVSGKAYNA